MKLFDDYDEDPEHAELVEMGLAIPLGDPLPEWDPFTERPDSAAWERLWRRRHPGVVSQQDVG